MADNLRGITSPDLTKIIRAALQQGWEWLGFTGTTHAAIRWPQTGEKVTFGTTPGVASWKTTATEIEKISGVKVWHKGNRKRSRRAMSGSGFDLYSVRRENHRWNSQWGDRVDQLQRDREDYIAEFHQIVTQRIQTRTDINRAAELLRRIAGVEADLESFHQPVDRFDPVAV